MARRKDHSPTELRQRIHDAAKLLIHHKGLKGLTARALAQRIGYTVGTLYNFYRDMDALITEVNFTTLQELYHYAKEKLNQAKPGYPSILALADAYIEFAMSHERSWRTLFIETNRSGRKTALPKNYQQCLSDLFTLIEETLQKNSKISSQEAAQAARLLWASLHGMTSLMLDGRLSLIGVTDPHAMIDDLLRRYLGISVKS